LTSTQRLVYTAAVSILRYFTAHLQNGGLDMRTARFIIFTLVVSLLPTYTFGKTEARAKFSGVVTEAPGVYEVAGAAQTSTTGFVQGTVTDPQGAVVAGAEVKLLDQATNRSQTEKTNPEGLYTFVNVLPGTYTVTVTTTGFRTAELGELKVEVNKSYTANFTLELGEVTAVVQVQASVAAELQSTDAQVGNVIETKVLRSLPTFGRSTLELISLQPT